MFAHGGKRAMGADIAGFGDPLADRDVPALFATDASGVDHGAASAIPSAI